MSLLKSSTFIFHVDFVVLDPEEDKVIALILGRSILRTAWTLIDVHGEKLILRVGDDQVELNFQNTVRYPHEVDSCWMIQELDEEPLDLNILRKSLERCLMNTLTKEEDIEDEDIKEMIR